ncbi:hypothetical protein [Bradyrhizobium sp.]|uniref:hypothetical protein n=1 Tax=Bradyrhizobium sp. TaxID=376 RepID=UPI0023838A82|nr:hypothetical protein [Bradyrhizobium sp.]MDE1937231.1 hypothetical protein [Bradyrhizobium sp.]
MAGRWFRFTRFGYEVTMERVISCNLRASTLMDPCPPARACAGAATAARGHAGTVIFDSIPSSITDIFSNIRGRTDFIPIHYFYPAGRWH